MTAEISLTAPLGQLNEFWENQGFKSTVSLNLMWLENIAEKERRSFSNQLNMTIEEWLNIKIELHPQFIKDIKASLKSGKPEQVWKG